MSTICGAGTAYPREHLSSPPVLSGVRVSQSLVFCVVFCKSLFVLFLSVGYAITLSVPLQFTASDYPFYCNASSNFSYIWFMGPSWLWSYGSWIYNYLCNQCLSPLMFGVWSRSERAVQHYVIKFVSDLRQVGGFLRFPAPINLTATI